MPAPAPLAAPTPVSPIALLVGGAFFMELLDGSIINTALPQMARSFGVDPVDLNPGVAAYLLTVAVFILPSGWLAERYGPRRVFTSAILLFTVSSVLCGSATSARWFVAARMLQGVGGAMMVPVGRLVVLRTTAKPDLMRAIAILTWPALTAPVLGPPLGGFISAYLDWRWNFLLNVPIGLVGIALALRLIPSGASAARRPFDWLGFALGAAACATLTVALELLGRVDSGWTTPAALAAATVALCGLLYRHISTHPHPLIGLQPFQTPSFKVTLLGGSLMRILISTMPFLLPLLFQLGFGRDPFHAGLLVLTLFAGNIGIKPLTSPILRRWRFRTVLVANGLVQATTMVACAFLTPAIPDILIAALLALSGASRSLQFTALNTLAFAEVPEQWTAMANTLFSLAFQFSIGMGVAVGAVALRASGTTGLPPSMTPSWPSQHSWWAPASPASPSRPTPHPPSPAGPDTVGTCTRSARHASVLPRSAACIARSTVSNVSPSSAWICSPTAQHVFGAACIGSIGPGRSVRIASHTSHSVISDAARASSAPPGPRRTRTSPARASCPVIRLTTTGFVFTLAAISWLVAGAPRCRHASSSRMWIATANRVATMPS